MTHTAVCATKHSVATALVLPLLLFISFASDTGSQVARPGGLSVMVAEGVDQVTLRRAAGHIPGTALPGQSGNVALSGHRDTYFRPLQKIRPNDIIALTTLTGEYRYRVVFTKVVGPFGLAVLDYTGNEVLTLVTCYPFYFLGSAPQRFIVRAERLGNTS